MKDHLRDMRDQERGIIANRLDYDRLRGFCDRRTDISDCRVTFATENQINKKHIFYLIQINQNEGKLSQN